MGVQLMNVKTYAVIKNGLVENIILVDEDNLPVMVDRQLAPISAGAEIGGGYDGEKLTSREEAG